jgi:hypothetical protein
MFICLHEPHSTIHKSFIKLNKTGMTNLKVIVLLYYFSIDCVVFYKPYLTYI